MVIGKADSTQETPFQTARREAYEEIGLPLTDTKLPPPFGVEHLTEFPCQLAMTNLGVRPCVAFLTPSASRLTSTKFSRTTNTTPTSQPEFPPINPQSTSPHNVASSSSPPSQDTPIPDVETTLIPRLDAHEVAAVFTAPFHDFLHHTNDPGWYRGQWQEFHGTRWRMHNFYVPATSRTIAQTKVEVATVTVRENRDTKGTEETKEDEILDGEKIEKQERGKVEEGKGKARGYEDQGSSVNRIIHPENRFRVFGMTARILVDAARVAYGEEPEFEANRHHGDEDMIARLLREGYLAGKKKDGEESVRRLARF